MERAFYIWHLFWERMDDNSSWNLELVEDVWFYTKDSLKSSMTSLKIGFFSQYLIISELWLFYWDLAVIFLTLLVNPNYSCKDLNSNMPQASPVGQHWEVYSEGGWELRRFSETRHTQRRLEVSPFIQDFHSSLNSKLSIEGTYSTLSIKHCESTLV